MDSDEPLMKLPKYCFVPICRNNSVKNPTKNYFSVPKPTKQTWCDAVGISCPNRPLYICDDHLNLEEDMENYRYWATMKGQVRAKLRLRVPEGLLAICSRQDGTLSNEPSTSQKALQICLPNTPSMFQPMKVDVGTNWEKNVVSKGVQVKPKTSDRTTNCLIVTKKTAPKTEVMDIDEDIIPSTQGSTTSITFSEILSETEETKESQKRIFMIDLIEKNPKDYIGLPKNYFWLIEYLEQKLGIKQMHILVTLYKIKNNIPFYQIRDMFHISLSTLWRCFPKTICTLSTFFRQLILIPDRMEIKINLPSSFKTNREYSNVFCIIDCFEVEIEKPSDPIQQSLTWSQYKNGNTLKYLLATTPDGFVVFVSAGFGGRASDVNILENCGFLDVVPPNSTILADRGFKHLEATLHRKQIKLLRPPSVIQNQKLTKQEAIRSKIIASLRIHVERVIRRIRMFKFLKPHSVINNKLVQFTDEVVIVACGLINLQDSIVKNE